MNLLDQSYVGEEKGGKQLLFNRALGKVTAGQTPTAKSVPVCLDTAGNALGLP